MWLGPPILTLTSLRCFTWLIRGVDKSLHGEQTPADRLNPGTFNGSQVLLSGRRHFALPDRRAAATMQRS